MAATLPIMSILHFRQSTIAFRHWTVDDAPSWLKLFSLYEPDSEESSYKVLHKRPPNSPVPLHTGNQLLQADFSLFQDIPIPQSRARMLWASIDVQPTALGRIVRVA